MDRAAGLGPGIQRRSRRFGESIAKALFLLCAVASVATTAGILLSLSFETIEFLRYVPLLDYLTGTRWAPTFADASFGVLPLVTATLLIAGIGVLVAFPIGMGIAVYLAEFSKRGVRRWLKPALEVLAGIPTVVFGYFALTLITPKFLEKVVPGMENRIFNALSAGLVVGVAIIPLIASISEDAMRAVPQSLREAAYGIGATRRMTAVRVVVPAALSGIVAAFILGLARAIGETMIVALAAGSSPLQLADKPLSAFDPRSEVQPMTGYMVQIFLGDTSNFGVEYRSSYAVAAALFVITFILTIIGHRVRVRFRQAYE